MRDKFLILNPGLSQSIAIAKLLRKHTDAHLVAGYFAGERQSVGQLYDESHTISAADFERFSDHIIVPTGAMSTEALFEHFENIDLGSIRFERANLRAGDKPLLLKMAQEQGVPVPSGWETYDDIPDGQKNIFYKPVLEGAGGPRSFAKTKQDIPQAVRTTDFLFQEFITGQGTHGCAFIAKDGEIVCHQNHFEKISNPRFGGSAAVIEKHEGERITELTARLIKAMNYNGWGLAEYKYCPLRDDFTFMEINAKFWASIEFSMRVNPEFAKLLFGVSRPADKVQGMVWPARLFASGLSNSLVASRDFATFPKIFEPGDLRLVLSSKIPAGLKKRLKGK